jgi:hypothetical protein
MRDVVHVKLAMSGSIKKIIVGVLKQTPGRTLKMKPDDLLMQTEYVTLTIGCGSQSLVQAQAQLKPKKIST